jgi:hypothetical protein
MKYMLAPFASAGILAEPLQLADHVRALGRRYTIRELVYEPWRAGQLAQELEREGGVAVQFNQNDQRVCPASKRSTPRSWWSRR